MQTAAAELMQSASAKCRENFTYPAKTKEQRDWQTGAIIHANAATAILALPGPTDAQLLAEAVKLPEVQSLVEYARDASSALAYIQLIRGRLSGIGWERLAGLQLACAPIEDALAKIGEAK